MQPGDLVVTKVELRLSDYVIPKETIGIVVKIVKKKYYNTSDQDEIVVSCDSHLFSVDRMHVRKMKQE